MILHIIDQHYTIVEIGDTKICARDVNDLIDACQGDSGGPMVIDQRGPDGKYRYHLIGVVSFGFRCNVPGFPGKICPLSSTLTHTDMTKY